MNKKNNHRFRETEIRMQTSMLEIMKNTELKKIAVKKICEKAGVNRSTFYAHFIDIYDMLDKMQIELRKELLESYKDTGKYTVFSQESFIFFLKHIKKHKYFYKINLSTRNTFPIQDGYEEVLNIIKSRCEKHGINNEEEILYYFIYFQAGFTMILKHWVDTDCIASEEEIAAIIKKCIPNIFTEI